MSFYFRAFYYALLWHMILWLVTDVWKFVKVTYDIMLILTLSPK